MRFLHTNRRIKRKNISPELAEITESRFEATEPRLCDIGVFTEPVFDNNKNNNNNNNNNDNNNNNNNNNNNDNKKNYYDLFYRQTIKYNENTLCDKQPLYGPHNKHLNNILAPIFQIRVKFL